METPLSPRLIGETEKSLNALLRRFLAGTDLSEPQWVTLRLAGTLDGTVDAAGLADAARDRAQFTDADDIVAALTTRELLDEGALTVAGLEVLDQTQARITEATRSVWEGLPEDDVAATTRVLNQIRVRARALLSEL